MAENELPDRIERVDAIRECDRARNIWLGLQGKHSHSYFLSWGWIGTWLECLPDSVRPELIVFFSAETPKAACFLRVERGVRHKFVFRKRAFINTTGKADFDSLVLEYNDVLGDDISRLLKALTESGEFSSIEEYRATLLTQHAFDELQAPPGFRKEDVILKPSFFIDLERIRDQGRQYIDLLDSSQRRQIKQSLRHYSNMGHLDIRAATSKNEALAMLQELRLIHQENWKRKRKSGAFSTEFFNKFHSRLVESRFDEGEIQLLQVSVGDSPLGYLYNFLYDQQVLYYQSGFSFGEGNHSRPGIICHYLAILHNLNLGYKTYNFLAGDSRYKRKLATGQDALYSVSIGKSSLKCQIERIVLGGLRNIRKIADE